MSCPYIFAATLVCILTVWTSSSRQAEATGTLALTIVDAATKQPIPARVEVLDKDGRGYVASDALLIGGD